MTSLYASLLRNIIIISALAWLGVVIFTRAETTHEVEELFDAQLAQEAGIIFEVSKKALQKDALLSSVLQKTTYGHKYEYKISFQIWQDDKLIFRTSNAPLDKFSINSGYSDRVYEDKKWRIFSTRKIHQNIEYTVITADEYDIRNELVNYVVLKATIPLLLVFPLLIILLHFAIKKAVTPLKTMANTVAEKDAMDFSAVQMENVPKEVEAIIISLNCLMQRLKVAFDKERRFTMNAAHELRTPIAALQVQAQVAKSSLDNHEQLLKALNNILAGTQRSTHLIAQMLTLARLEPEAIKERFQYQDIAEVIRSSVSEYVPFALEKEIEISFDILSNYPCDIYHDPHGIQIMINNLIQNAIRYTPRLGEVNISLECDQESCKIEISDSGPGIHEAEMKKVLERYYRTTQNQNGCGLGLSIVKQIVDIHLGTLKLYNNNGLLVSISIPQQG